MPTNLYGPNDNYDINNSHVIPGLISKFVDAERNSLNLQPVGGQEPLLREFMHVDDLASAILYCLEYWSPSDKNAPLDQNGIPHNFLNVGTGLDITIKDLSKLISKISGFKGKILWDKSKPWYP